MYYKSEDKIIKEDLANIAKELGPIAYKLNGATVLIAGGAGFLGRYLVLTIDYLNEHVLKQPCKVIIIDNFITGTREWIKQKATIKVIQHDVSKPISIPDNIDFIMHAASIASPVFYNLYRLETIDVGILGTRNLLELAREKKIKSFLFFSSSEVYGNPDPKFIPTPEEYNGNVSCVGARACYDEPKRMGETLCVNYADIYNLPVKIVRPFNIFGPGMRFDDGRAVMNFVVSALKGEKIPVYGDGKNTRTFCYITNTIIGFFQVLLSDHNREIFNIGSDEQEIQMSHLAEIVSALIMKEDVEISKIVGPNETYAKADPNRRFPDLTKIRRLVGYNPQTNLVTGLRRFITWAEEELEYQRLYGFQQKCRICDNPNLKKALSLGETPLANSLLSKKELENEEELYPLELVFCNKCNLCQLSYVVHPERMFKHYLYVSSTTQSFDKHFEDLADKAIKDLSLGQGAFVIDIGSNDGILLKKFKEKGLQVLGIEPATNICEIARKSGIDTINDFFNSEIANTIIKLKGKADVITATNVFAHIPDIKDFTSNVKNLIKDDGTFIIEVQYLLDTLQKITFDNIYHEHVSYFSVISLDKFFKDEGMQIVKVEHVDSHGGSIRVFIKTNNKNLVIDKSVEEFIESERVYGLNKEETYEKFAQKVLEMRNKLINFIKTKKEEGKKIIGYGAPAKATTLLNFYQINKDHLDYIIDDNKLKQGLFIPGVRIPIISKENMGNPLPDYALILAWNFADEIILNNKFYTDKGVKFVIPIPEPRIV